MAELFRQGAGRLCLDFTRTLRHRGTDHAVEELPDGPSLSAWVAQCGPVAAAPHVVPAALVRDAQHLRESVFTLLVLARAGRPCPTPPRTPASASTRPRPARCRPRRWTSAATCAGTPTTPSSPPSPSSPGTP
ncbi:ABATE domain-containing protein [Dactylosporangium darangshiense]|uniref:ABATE domain-containing protein n=1 Tax=Dactylosporangium darangshiense TaxID=579108 RepID=UPI003638FB1F